MTNKSLIGVAAVMAMLGGMEIKKPPLQKIEPQETKAHKKMREDRAKKRKQKRKNKRNKK